MNKAFCGVAKRLSGTDPDTGTAAVDGVKKASKAWFSGGGNGNHGGESGCSYAGAGAATSPLSALLLVFVAVALRLRCRTC